MANVNRNILEELLKRKRLEEQQRQQVATARNNRVILPIKKDTSSTQNKNTIKNTSSNNTTPQTKEDINKLINSMNKVNSNQKQIEKSNFNKNLWNTQNSKIVNLSEDEIKEAKKTTRKINMNNSNFVESFKNLGKNIDDATNISGVVSNLGLGIEGAVSKGISLTDKALRYVSPENIKANALNFIGTQWTKSPQEVKTGIKVNGEELTVTELQGLALGLKEKDPQKSMQLLQYANKVYKENRETPISRSIKEVAKSEHAKVFENDSENSTGLIDYITDKWADNEQVNREREEKIQANINKGNNIVGKKLAELSSGMGSTVLGMVGTAINPVLGTSLFMTSAGGAYYDEAKQRGMSDDESFAYALIMGSAEGLTEKFISGDMVSKAKEIATGSGLTSKTLKSFGLNIGENFAQEALTEPISEITAYVVGGKDTANFDDMYGRMLESGWNGLLSATILAGASAGIGSAVAVTQKGKNATLEENIQAYNDTVASGKVDQANIAKGVVQALTEQAETIKIQDTETNNKRRENVLPNLKDKIIENKAENDLRQQITQEENKIAQNRNIEPINNIMNNKKLPLNKTLNNLNKFNQSAIGLVNNDKTQALNTTIKSVIQRTGFCITYNTNLTDKQRKYSKWKGI